MRYFSKNLFVAVNRTILSDSCKEDNEQMKSIKQVRYVVASLAKDVNEALC